MGEGLGGNRIIRGLVGNADGHCVEMEFALTECLRARFRRGKDGEIALLSLHFGCERIGIRGQWPA